jgi:hypothetical protein
MRQVLGILRGRFNYTPEQAIGLEYLGSCGEGRKRGAFNPLERADLALLNSLVK